MKATNPLIRKWLHIGLVYLLLISGSLVFMWPFLWMIMASFKTDREMFAAESGFFPTIPDPPMESPFVVLPPGHVSPDLLTGRKRDMVRDLIVGQQWVWPETIDAAAAEEMVLERVEKRLSGFVPENFSGMDETERDLVIRRVVTPSLLATERATVLRTLVVGPLIVRSRDLREEILIPIEEIDRVWKVDDPEQARWLVDPDTQMQGRVLNYRFDKDGRITLTADLQTSFPAADLDEIRLFMKPDDSWHAVECRVFADGRVLRAREEPPLSDVRWRTFTWKLPALEPLPANTLRTWVDLLPVEGEKFEASGPNSVRLEITLVQQSRLQAFLKKAWQNYGLVLEQVPFLRYTATSLFLVIVQVIAAMASCSLVAYSFARLRWPGRIACFAIMLGTMMLPGQVTMIPYFLIIKELGWYNTLLPLWVPTLFANAFFVFLLVQFMRGIPRDLEDAAAIDGCGVFRIYWHVMIPLIKPTLAAIAIFTFMGVWNDFMGPLIFLQDQRLYPLSLGLYALNVQSGGGMGMMMAGSFLMTLPVIVIFLFAQRYFLQGITLTGMK